MNEQSCLALLHQVVRKSVQLQYQLPDWSTTSSSEGYRTLIIAVKCQQTSEDMAVYIKRQLVNTLSELSDYTGYSTPNNKIMVFLPRSYSTIDSQSVCVLSNHTWIPTTKLLTQIRRFLESKKVEKQVRCPDITPYPVLKMQDLVISHVKSTWPCHTLFQNRECLTCSRLKLFLVTCFLFLNAQ